MKILALILVLAATAPIYADPDPVVSAKSLADVLESAVVQKWSDQSLRLGRHFVFYQTKVEQLSALKRLIERGSELVPLLIPFLDHRDRSVRIAALLIIQEISLRIDTKAIVYWQPETDSSAERSGRRQVPPRL